MSVRNRYVYKIKKIVIIGSSSFRCWQMVPQAPPHTVILCPFHIYDVCLPFCLARVPALSFEVFSAAIFPICSVLLLVLPRILSF